MFRSYMALEEKDLPLVTVTQTAPADRANAVTRPNTDDVEQLPERDSKRYEFVSEHGRGGLGRVMRTRDKELRREVAIKEILYPGGVAEARFVREAMITARLEHPGIVPVHDAGRWADGTLFYSMKLVSGRPLKELITAKSTFADRVALLPHVIAVAEAVAYAHDRRVIHRDLKPSNVIIGAFGETVVIDWGLAKDLDAKSPDLVEGGPYRTASPDGELTVAGTVLGTPAYMAPEQARGGDTTERSDIYALGAILYHVLRGAAPYTGSSADILTAVRTEAPPPVELLVPDLPKDLAAIVSKAMAREPLDRYPSAKSFAEDLRRFQTGKLVDAHDYSAISILIRWLRKHRIAAAVVGGLAVVTIAISALSLQRILRERAAATDARDAAESRTNELLLVQAESQLPQDPTASLDWTLRFAERNKEMGLARDIAADAISRGAARYVIDGSGAGLIEAVAFGRDGRIVSTKSSSLLTSWSPSTGTRRLANQIFDNSKLIVAEASNKLAFEDGTGGVAISDYDGHIEARLTGHSGAIVKMTFSPDGAWILTSDWKSITRLWKVTNGGAKIWERTDVATGAFCDDGHLLLATTDDKGRSTVVHRLDRNDNWAVKSEGVYVEGEVVDISPGPDDASFAFSTLDGRISFYDGVKHRVRDLGGVDGIAHIAVSGDGHYIAGGSRKGGVKLWRVSDGALLSEYHHAKPVISISFLQGNVLVSTGEEGNIRLVDADNGATSALSAGGPVVIPVAISQDGHWLAAGSRSDIRVWDLTYPLPIRGDVHRGQAFHPLFLDDHTIASDGMDGRIVAWDFVANSQAVLGEHDDLTFGLSASDDRSILGWASHDGSAGLRSTTDGHSERLRGHQGSVMDIAVAHDGRFVATAGADRTVLLWALDGRLIRRIEGFRDLVYRVQFSTDTRYVSAMTRDGMLRIISTSGNEPPVDFVPPNDKVIEHRWIPGSHRVLLGTEHGLVAIWSWNPAHLEIVFQHHALVTGLAVRSDGSWIASAGRDGLTMAAKVGGGQVSTFRTIGTEPSDIILHPNRPLLLATCRDGTVRMWNLHDGSASVLRYGAGSATASTLSPSGDTVSTTVDSGTVTAWRLDKSMFVPNDASSFKSWLSGHFGHSI